jgi:CubicO group peptidase (beta-lactamase class C family)
VRVNVMALAALQVWRRPLPEVLREEVMEPIGASSTWRWYGYENSWVDLDGQKMQSVSGGGHWGGGMFINSYDMARFGYMYLRNGKWKDQLDRVGEVDPDGADAGLGQQDVRLRELVPEHRPQAACRRRRRRRSGSWATDRTSSTSTGTTTSSRCSDGFATTRRWTRWSGS